MATLIFAGGVEQGTAAGLATGAVQAKYFDRVVGTAGTNVEVVAAAVRSGTYGLRLSPTSATAHCGWQNGANNGILGSAGTLVGQFWFRFPTSLPSGDFTIFICYGTAGGQDFYLKYLSSTGGLQAVVGAATQLGPTISADTWYRVDFRLVLDANPHTLDWKINGTDQTQVSHAVASENIFQAGFSIDNATQSGTVHIDDILLSLTSGDYPLGAHKVLALTVDPADTVTLSGTAGNFQTFAGATPTMTAWNATTARNNVDERPPNLGSSQDGFAQITLATGDYVQSPMTTYTLQAGESIAGARMVACCWAATTSAATIGFRSYNGTAETILFAAANPSANNTSTPSWVCKMLTLADINTQGELDALAIRTGFSGDATPDEGVHAVYVEVAITEATSVTHNADASVTATADRTVTAAADHAADANPTITAGLIVTGDAARPASASVSATATITADADVTAAPVEIDTAATTTVTVTPIAAAEHPASGSLTVTATGTADAAADHLAAASVSITGTITSTASAAHDSTTTTGVSAAVTADAAADFAASATQTTTASITAAADVGAAPITIDSASTVTANVTGAATRDIPVTAPATVFSSVVADAAAEHPIDTVSTATAQLTATATRSASTTVALAIAAGITVAASVAGPVVFASGNSSVTQPDQAVAGFAGAAGALVPSDSATGEVTIS